MIKNEQDDFFVSIEVQSMDYFSEPVKAIYLRDVTKLVSNHVLKCRNSRELSKIQSIKYSNSNVAHEMRAPLSSIIILIGILLTLGQSARDKKRAREFYHQIRIQAELLLHYVNDMLDFSNITIHKYEKKMCKFNPNKTIKSIVEMFKIQVRSSQLVVEQRVNRFLDYPCKQGERIEPLIELYDENDMSLSFN